MRIISHRGRHEDFSFPANTLPAVKSIWHSGLCGVEIDVWVTADKKIVLSHDPKIKAVNGAKYPIQTTVYDSLNSLDLGQGIGPALLQDILATIPKRGKIFVEIKCGQEILLPLKTLMNKYVFDPEQIAFIGFVDTPQRAETMANVAEVFREYDMYTLFGRTLLLRRRLQAMRAEMAHYIVNQTLAIKGKGIDVPFQLAHEELFTLAKINGLSCHVWNVFKLKQLQWLNILNVDTVTTDKPKTLTLGLAS